MQPYLEITKNVYKEAAENPQEGLCCHNSNLAITRPANSTKNAGNELWLWKHSKSPRPCK